jgi:hypothetical protein
VLALSMKAASESSPVRFGLRRMSLPSCGLVAVIRDFMLVSGAFPVGKKEGAAIDCAFLILYRYRLAYSTA